jgi:hypothetical protein
MFEESKDMIEPYTDEGVEGIWLIINPTFPVEVTENKMYTFTDYIVSIGG